MSIDWAGQRGRTAASAGEGEYGGGGGGGTTVGGSRPAYQIIENRGIFDFSEARQVAEDYFLQYREAGAEEGPLEFTRDIVYLSAAEYSLLTRALIIGPGPMLPIRDPLTVGPNDMVAAIIKAICSAMNVCRPKIYEDAVQLWDIALFAGDMTKIELIHGSKLQLYEVEDTIMQLEDQYAHSPTDVGRAIGASGMLRIQGVLWKAKLALNIVPNDVESNIDSYLQRIPLVHT
jgi:hypothetical protein